MDTDQNNGDRSKTKAALLGELESIKDLLSEEEMADIPLLDQPVDQTPGGSITSDESFTEIPLLTDIPLLEESVSSGPTTDSPFEALNESIDATLAHISVDIDLTDEVQGPEVLAEEAHGEQESPSGDHGTSTTSDSAGEESLVNTDCEDELTSPLEQEIAELEHELEESPLNEESLASVFPPFLSETADNEEFTSTPPEKYLDSEHSLESESALSSEEAAESESTEAEVLTAIEPTEEPLQVGVLPGQRNLFDDSIADNHAPASQAHQKTDTQARAKTSTQPQNKPRAKIEQAKGENPFLPKHIRERLHTTKSLMEVIKEAPLDTQAVYHNKFVNEHPEAQALEPSEDSRAEKLSEHDKLDILINEVIAEFMPKIEAELRVRLTSLAQQRPTEADTENEQAPPLEEPNND